MKGAPWTSGAASARPTGSGRARWPRLARPGALAGAALALALGAGAARASEGGPEPRGALATSAARDDRLFEEALDRFVPVFPATTARYFPYTDLGPRPGDAIAAPSEVERYAVLVAPRRSPDPVMGVLAAPAPAVVATPLPLLTLRAGGALSRAWSAPGSAFAATGWQATLAAPAGPLRGRAALVVAEEVRGTSASPSSSRVGAQSTASLRLRLAEGTTLELEEHRSSERGGPGDGVVVDGARVTGVLALWPRVLELTATSGADRVQAEADAAATERTFASAGLTAHLTPALTLSGATSVQRGVLTPAASANALFGQLPASRLATGAVAWRASDRLQLSAAVSRVETSVGARAARQVRVAWAPVAGGRLRLSAAYEEGVDAASGTRTAQAVLQPSVRVGRFASVEASVTQAIAAVAGPVAHPLAALVSFTIRS